MTSKTKYTLGPEQDYTVATDAGLITVPGRAISIEGWTKEEIGWELFIHNRLCSGKQGGVDPEVWQISDAISGLGVSIPYRQRHRQRLSQGCSIYDAVAEAVDYWTTKGRDVIIAAIKKAHERLGKGEKKT